MIVFMELFSKHTKLNAINRGIVVFKNTVAAKTGSPERFGRFFYCWLLSLVASINLSVWLYVNKESHLRDDLVYRLKETPTVDLQDRLALFCLRVSFSN